MPTVYVQEPAQRFRFGLDVNLSLIESVWLPPFPK